MSTLAAVIPAAGFSSRMGRFKPLLELDGLSVLGRVLCCLEQIGITQRIVVTGHRSREVTAEAERHGAGIVFNPDFESGMLGSIQTGVAAVPSGIDAFFLWPADIPLVRPWTLKHLMGFGRKTGALLVRPTFQKKSGHPPLISMALRTAILGHDGPGGLRGLFSTLDDVADCPVWDKNILMDMDRPKDFQTITSRLAGFDILDMDEAWALMADVLDIPPQGLAHGREVGRVARDLARAVNLAGGRIDEDFVQACGMVHDMAKGRPRHEREGGRMLRAMGLEPMAEVVEVHRDVPPPADKVLTARELVCLADKLVRGHERVGVGQRFEEKLEIFGRDPEARTAILGRMENALALRDLVEKTTGRRVADILGGGPQ